MDMYFIILFLIVAVLPSALFLYYNTLISKDPKPTRKC